MSETHNNDPFDSIVAGLKTDDDFLATLDDAQAEDVAEREVSRAESIESADFVELYTFPHTEKSLGETATKIAEIFYELCRRHGVDVAHVANTPHAYMAIHEELALEVYGMRSELWVGDTISAQNALIVDMGVDEDDHMDVVGVSDGDRVVGTFVAPVIGPMPDEFTALTRGTAGEPPMGVGLILENAIVIEANGDIHTEPFSGHSIIVSLGVMGLQLDKYLYT